MPMVRVATNIASSLIRESFEIQLTEVLAKALTKPIGRILVEVNADARLIHGGTKDPAVLIAIRSIGSLSPEQNEQTTQMVTDLCVQSLNLPKDKVIIEYYDLNPSNVGFNGLTVAAANRAK